LSACSVLSGGLAVAGPAAVSPGTLLFLEHNVTDFQATSDTFRNGFAAGLYDMVSLYAVAAQGSGGIDSQKAQALVRCLDGKGDKLGQFRAWVDSVIAQAAPESDAVVSFVVDACQR